MSADDRARVIAEDAVFIGSVALMDALHKTAEVHTSFVETDPPEGVRPYIWCACEWRSDDLDRPAGEDQAAYLVHLSNALHAAAVVALQPIVLRKAPVERILAQRAAPDPRIAAVEAFCVDLESTDDYVRSWKCARALRALLEEGGQ